MRLSLIKRILPHGVIPMVMGAVVALTLFPVFLKYFVGQESPLEAQLSFTSDVPSVKVQWDDPRVISEPYKFIPIPGHSKPTSEWHVRISSTGERHPDSRSSEVWVFGLETPENRLDPKDVSTDGASKWFIGPDKRAVGETLYAAAFNGPKVWEGRIVGSGLTLHLLNHSWSGKVAITVNGVTEDVDLYAPSDGVIVSRRYPNSSAASQTMMQGRISFSVPSGQTYTDELLFSSSGAGSVVVTAVSSAGRDLARIGPNKFQSPKMGQSMHLYAAGSSVAVWLAFSALFAFFGSFLKPIVVTARGTVPVRLPAFILAGVATGLLIGWNLFALSLKVALVNAVPSFIAFAVVLAIAARLSFGWRSALIGFWFFLTLRTPLLGSTSLYVTHAAALVFVVVISFKLIFDSIGDIFCQRITLVGFALMVLVSLTHLGIISPYTYAAIRPAWPDQYIMGIGGVLTNADLPHFMDLFQAYTKPQHEAGFSVVLRRFFYEYLWSTAWPVQPVWVVGVVINLLLWFGAMVALLHLARHIIVSQQGLAVVVLGIGASIGFAAVVGQPIVYLAAYAWVPILLLSVVHFSNRGRWREREFYFALIAAAAATYDVLPLSVAAALTLIFVRQYTSAILWLIVHFAVTLAWSQLTLSRVLGTFGNPSNAEFLTKSIKTWKECVTSGDLEAIRILIVRGFENAAFAGFGVGLLVIPCLLFALRRPVRPQAKLVVIVCFMLTFMYLASSCVIAPQLPVWSPGGLIPRYSYYYYPASLLAFGVLADRLPRWLSGVLVGGLVLLVFADTLGYFQPAMLLHYGNWYGTFTKW
ncbi:MAG: hypothetical protein ACK5GN_06615 [Pseudomonadota bacterium]